MRHKDASASAITQVLVVGAITALFVAFPPVSLAVTQTAAPGSATVYAIALSGIAWLISLAMIVTAIAHPATRPRHTYVFLLAFGEALAALCLAVFWQTLLVFGSLRLD